MMKVFLQLNCLKKLQYITVPIVSLYIAIYPIVVHCIVICIEISRFVPIHSANYYLALSDAIGFTNAVLQVSMFMFHNLDAAFDSAPESLNRSYDILEDTHLGRQQQTNTVRPC